MLAALAAAAAEAWTAPEPELIPIDAIEGGGGVMEEEVVLVVVVLLHPTVVVVLEIVEFDEPTLNEELVLMVPIEEGGGNAAAAGGAVAGVLLFWLTANAEVTAPAGVVTVLELVPAVLDDAGVGGIGDCLLTCFSARAFLDANLRDGVASSKRASRTLRPDSDRCNAISAG